MTAHLFLSKLGWSCLILFVLCCLLYAGNEEGSKERKLFNLLSGILAIVAFICVVVLVWL